MNPVQSDSLKMCGLATDTDTEGRIGTSLVLRPYRSIKSTLDFCNVAAFSLSPRSRVEKKKSMGGKHIDQDLMCYVLVEMTVLHLLP